MKNLGRGARVKVVSWRDRHSLRVKLLMIIQFLLEECCVGVGGGRRYVMQQNLLGDL